MDKVRAFSVARGQGRPSAVRAFRSEADTRRFVVRNAQVLLGLHVLAIEYPIATNGGGRIDVLAIDGSGSPTIIEFKRTASGTAICQGLYYLDWLDRRRDVFSLLVVDRLGPKAAERITWVSPRLNCLAEEIGEREEAVARQIGRPVELVQLRRYARGVVVVQRPVLETWSTPTSEPLAKELHPGRKPKGA